MQETKPNTLAWINENRDLCMELLRIYLGVGLFIKGIYFLMANDQLFEYTQSIELPFVSYLLVHLIVLAHLCGGFLLAIGLLTRVAALIQLPILFGAVLFVHSKEGLFSFEQTLEFAMLVLFLLVIFCVYGGGRLSVDSLLDKRNRTSSLP
jgi:putative oxidoreductase